MAGNTPYENFFVENEIEDQYASHLDLSQFCTVDNGLEATDGMKVVKHIYTATNATEKLAKGAKNASYITSAYTEKEYVVQRAQNTFQYYDDDLMKDPECVLTGIQRQGIDLFNATNVDVFAALNTATLTLAATTYGFGTFADAVALLNMEPETALPTFAFINSADTAAVRKALTDDLKYVEDFVRTGYIGTVAGINIYTKKDAVKGTICLGTQKAVTLFVKKGVEVEQDRDIETKSNIIVASKHYIAALTDATQAVKITVAAG